MHCDLSTGLEDGGVKESVQPGEDEFQCFASVPRSGLGGREARDAPSGGDGVTSSFHLSRPAVV